MESVKITSDQKWAKQAGSKLNITMNKLDKSHFGVLVADDSEDDRYLLRSAVRTATSLRIIAEVSDGVGVMAYLRGQAEFSDRERFPLPDMLLLDLKMPRKNGFEVLEWLRTQRFENISIVVLTDSLHPQHLKRALDLGADRFQVKPNSIEERHMMILALEKYLHGIPVRAQKTAARFSGSSP
jgi:CheY-like chemotaxis protein